MPEPITNSSPAAPPSRFMPWVVFAVLLVVAVVAFFRYADRVPSLLQALADR